MRAFNRLMLRLYYVFLFTIEIAIMDPHQKARLRWQCRRGMLELDLMLQNFLEHQLDTLNEDTCAAFENLLSYSDPQLYVWLMGEETPESMEIAHLVQLIRMCH